ncbi:MAG: hypothetical protein NTU99_16040 [Pseudanabaena sp. LacPavin_0818_WC45_MAG_42_6]|nr:hypothetical protein [Pseudanabaena sp. LacPavin_0818_WC45_MAG_42_6]
MEDVGNHYYFCIIWEISKLLELNVGWVSDRVTNHWGLIDVLRCTNASYI